MAAPALKIVLRPGKGKGSEPPPSENESEDSDMPSYGKGKGDDEGDDLDGEAKREALGKLADALGLKVKDEGAALEALETLIYHCAEG
jgi:hypothetical protein